MNDSCVAKIEAHQSLCVRCVCICYNCAYPMNTLYIQKECECYEEEVQPYRKTDYKPIIYLSINFTNRNGIVPVSYK